MNKVDFSPKILIVGAGFGQIPAITKAKKMGIHVITVDRNPAAPGMILADKAYALDVTDCEEILKIAIENQINGVLTLQSDLPVPTVGYINDKLGLTGVSYKVAKWCSDKVETRRRLHERSCIQPNFKVIQEISELTNAIERIGLPCVIKAPDSSGSRGIMKVEDIADAERGFHEAKKFSRIGQILVEEFIDGLEFGAQTFSVNGECKLVLIHNDTMSPPPYMIPIGHSFPFVKLSNLEKDRVVGNIKLAISALEIMDGPANVDLILNKENGEVNIIEIGARIGATCLPELVFYHSGIDWIKESIKCAIGSKPDLSIKKNQPVAAQIIESPKDGIISSYSIPDPLPNHIVEFEIDSKAGEQVRKLRKGTDRIGKIIAISDNALSAEKVARNYLERLKFEIE